MKLAPGPHGHTSTDGMTIHVDRTLTREQVDMVCRVIANAGLTPNEVAAIEFDGERPPAITTMKMLLARLTRLQARLTRLQAEGAL